MLNDPRILFGEKKETKRGCKLPHGQTGHCEQDFGPHLAINGIGKNKMDFFCSMYHANGHPWLLGIPLSYLIL